jgi:hypothetical protein
MKGKRDHHNLGANKTFRVLGERVTAEDVYTGFSEQGFSIRTAACCHVPSLHSLQS